MCAVKDLETLQEELVRTGEREVKQQRIVKALEGRSTDPRGTAVMLRPTMLRVHAACIVDLTLFRSSWPESTASKAKQFRSLLQATRVHLTESTGLEVQFDCLPPLVLMRSVLTGVVPCVWRSWQQVGTRPF